MHRKGNEMTQITDADRAEIKNPPWCYDDSGQQFEYVSVGVARRLLDIADATCDRERRLVEALRTILLQCPDNDAISRMSYKHPISLNLHCITKARQTLAELGYKLEKEDA